MFEKKDQLLFVKYNEMNFYNKNTSLNYTLEISLVELIKIMKAYIKNYTGCIPK